MNFLNFFILKLLVKVKYANIFNIISNNEIIPELLQTYCNENKIYETFDLFMKPKYHAYGYIDPNVSRDGNVSVSVGSLASWSGEVSYILLDTQNWYAWGSDGWIGHTAGAYACEDFNVSVPAPPTRISLP